MKKIKINTFDDVIEKARKKQKEWDEMTDEQKADALATREEILKELRGPGFTEIMLGGKCDE